MKQVKWILLAALVLPLMVWTTGCSTSNNSTLGGSTTTATVDLAAGDKRHISAADFVVYLWLNVLQNTGPGIPDPDATLDIGDRTPIDLKFYNGDLYVAATDTIATMGGLLIYRDYLNASDGDSPDVVLYDAADPLMGPGNIQELALENNVLVGTTFYTTPHAGVFIWDNASSLTSGDAPDAYLFETTTGFGAGEFDDMTDVELVDGQLFVSNWNGGAGNPALAIWDDVQDLITNGASAPDVVLTDDVNLLALGNGGRALTIADDILYLAGGDQINIYVFNDASSLTDASLPDIILQGCVNYNEGCYINAVTDMEVYMDTLWLTNMAYNTADFHDPGVVGFSPASNLFSNQPPNVLLTGNTLLPSAQRLAIAGDAMFVTGAPDPSYNNNVDVMGVFGYRNVWNIESGSQPDFASMGSDTPEVNEMESPTALAATVRGTMDNIVIP